MKRLLMISCTVAILASAADVAGQQARTTRPTAGAVRYGDNVSVGRRFMHDGVSLYYEVYGTGEPLLLVHGNGGSIADLRAQIDHFRKRYRVIAMDSRDQGKSGDSQDPLTYEKMADDLAALVDHLNVESANVVGWSDGAIEALLLGIRHPAKVKKIVAMAANLNPGTDAVYPEVLDMVNTMIAGIPAEARSTPQGRRELKVAQMLLAEPNVPLDALKSITAPTLVAAGDHDVIRDEHTIAIFQHIPNGQLAIFPAATHMLPFDDPARFNAAVDRFLQTPFQKKDRVNDLLKSLEKMRNAAHPQ